jgi:ABC-type sulfate transport system permease component
VRPKLNVLKLISIFSGVLLLVPIIYLLYYGYGPFLVVKDAFGKLLISSIEFTFFSAAVSVITVVLAFTPLAYFLARHSNPIMESIVDIPASIPHPLVGIALVFIDSPITPLGKFLYDHGIIFYYSYLGVFLALIIVSSPIYIRAMQNFFKSLPLEPEIYAISFGYSEFYVFRKIALRKGIGGIVSAGLTSVARAISEFGSIVIIAPYVTGWIFNGDCTSSIYIYNEFQTYFNASVSAAATLIVFSLILIVSIRIINYVLEKRNMI